jgi:hypothetical protein
MLDLLKENHQIHCVSSFQDLVITPFHGNVNALCWTRNLQGDFSEIVNKISLSTNIVELEEEELRELPLTEQGQLARSILLNDLSILKAHGASPILNLIKCYDRDDVFPLIPTDVYSYHIDRSPIPSDTFLCTYFGESSEILPNSQAQQKILVPEIQYELKKLYGKEDAGFESFLKEHFYDLHYQALSTARPINLGLGHLWRLAIDHPESKVLPCIHRAPIEKHGETRLMMIC